MNGRQLCIKSLGFGLYTVEVVPPAGDLSLAHDDFESAAAQTGSELRSWFVVGTCGFMACSEGHVPTERELSQLEDVRDQAAVAAAADVVISDRVELLRLFRKP